MHAEQIRCNKLDLQASEVLSELQVIYKVNLKHSQNGKEFTKVVTLTNLQKNILKALKCSV